MYSENILPEPYKNWIASEVLKEENVSHKTIKIKLCIEQNNLLAFTNGYCKAASNFQSQIDQKNWKF